jgi:hypothetical protein
MRLYLRANDKTLREFWLYKYHPVCKLRFIPGAADFTKIFCRAKIRARLARHGAIA